MWAIGLGVLLGFSAGLAPGPLLALVITQTLRHGTREGILVAAAPLLSDLPMIFLSWMLLERLSEFEWVLGAISLLGGLYLLYLAVETFRAGPTDLSEARSKPRSMVRGAVVNLLNPHPYLFWISVGVPLVRSTASTDVLAAILFVFFFYVLLVGTKVALAWGVGRSRDLLSGWIYRYCLRLMGLFLAVLGGYLLVESAHRLGLGPGLASRQLEITTERVVAPTEGSRKSGKSEPQCRACGQSLGARFALGHAVVWGELRPIWSGSPGSGSRICRQRRPLPFDQRQTFRERLSIAVETARMTPSRSPFV